jgi:hypothetical protein
MTITQSVAQRGSVVSFRLFVGLKRRTRPGLMTLAVIAQHEVAGSSRSERESFTIGLDVRLIEQRGTGEVRLLPRRSIFMACRR